MIDIKIITLLESNKDNMYLYKSKTIKPFLCDSSKSIVTNIIDFFKRERKRNNG